MMSDEPVRRCNSCGIVISSGTLCGLCQSVHSGGEIPPPKDDKKDGKKEKNG